MTSNDRPTRKLQRRANRPSRPRRNTECEYHRNLKMDDGVYSLRRQVMEHLYEAKALVPDLELPRVKVRITECSKPRVLGTASMGDCVIWIPASTVSRDDLRAVVFHEILHAVYAIEHRDGCPLMDPTAQSPSPATQDRLFRKYARTAAKQDRRDQRDPLAKLEAKLERLYLKREATEGEVQDIDAEIDALTTAIRSASESKKNELFSKKFPERTLHLL